MLPRVLTTLAAAALGISEDAVRHRLRTGAWTRLARGAYLTEPGPPAWRDRVEAAALLTSGVVSHTTAAALHRFDVTPARDAVHLTVSRRSGRHQRRGIRVHFADLAPGDIVRCDGLPVTSPVRTALDCARMLPQPLAVRALECAPWHLVSARAPAHLLRLADPRSESVLETELRILLTLAGLPPTDIQLTVTIAGRTYRLDLAYRYATLAIEVDGRAHHSDAVAFRRDRERQNALVGAGWTVLRFTADDLHRRPEYVVATIRAVLAVSGAETPA